MLKVAEFFGGIGACTQALKRLGIDFQIADYVEIDKYAVKSYNAINDTNFEPQDITEWDKDIDVDLIMHGSPCQDFSLAGKQAGGDEGSGTRSSLMYETIRIVEKLKPKYVVWENVKNVLSKKHRHNFDAYLEKMESFGYVNHYQVLNSKDYGIPQNRERVFCVSILNGGNFEFPEKEELKLRLKDMLELEVDEKYYLRDDKIQPLLKEIEIDNVEPFNPMNDGTCRTIKNQYYKNSQANFIKQTDQGATCVVVKTNTKKGYEEAFEGDSINFEQPNSNTRRGRVGKGVAQTLTTSCNQGVVLNPLKDKTEYGWHFEQNVYDSNGISRSVKAGGGSGNIPKVIEKQPQLRIRKLTPKECWRLMGFSDEAFEKAEKVNSNTQLYKQAGNSIVVDVLVKIFTNLLLEEKEEVKKISEKKTVTIETDKMIDLVALQEKEPELFEELVADYPCEDATYIFEVKTE